MEISCSLKIIQYAIISYSKNISGLIQFGLEQSNAFILIVITYGRVVKCIFTGGHISLVVALKGPNVVLGLYKCNYSLTVKQDLHTATG